MNGENVLVACAKCKVVMYVPTVAIELNNNPDAPTTAAPKTAECPVCKEVTNIEPVHYVCAG